MTQQADESARNVIICVDNSEHSERAFEYYLENVCKAKDNVIVFHAQELPAMPTAPYPFGGSAYDGYEEVIMRADKDAKVLLQHYGKRLQARTDVPVTFKLVKEGGNPGEVICKNIKDENARIVVLGSRGQGTIRRTILGSVSDYVVHHSHVPVCVVPPPEQEA